MGIFDGYLLMSDIDGTFETHKHREPQANIDAIKYFTRNGGRFAFATGRMSDYLIERGFTRFINAPCCQCNGALVYDYENKKELYKLPLALTVSELASILQPYKAMIKKFIAPIRTETAAHEPIDIDNIPDDIADKFPIKQITVFESPEDADILLPKLVNDPRLQGCYVCKSWDKGIEILGKNSTKGEAIDYVKDYCGCHTSVGIGDYGNDIPLAVHADIGVAVDNAIDKLKAVADMVVCACEDDAIADLIYKLEQKIKERGLK